MKPTAEQQAILNVNAAVVRINARAGTGKTTTLAMLARKHKDKRILYLVFNRQAREEARDRFPPNTDVLTVHALAYRREGYKWKASLGHFSPADMLFGFAANENKQELATISYEFLTFFLNSPYPRLEDAAQPFCAYQPELRREVFQHYQQRIIQAARQLSTAWNTGGQQCPHDFYLKLFHKSGQFARELARYDLILVDEGQDLSSIMLDALRTCQQRIFLVGDSHQQIYSFRYAIDAMQKLDCDAEYELTHSFRFGEAIAQLATLLIQETKQEHRFRIQGNERKTSHIDIYQQRIGKPDPSRRTAILSRSNVALFENAMTLRARAIPFHFERDLYPMLMKTLDIYWFAQERKDKVRDPLLRSFNSLKGVTEYAEKTDNSQLQGILKIVKRFKGEFPDAIFEMMSIQKEQQQSETQNGVILSTIHSAKGQEYEQVYIHKDMAERLEKAINDLEHASDEINVAYVGFTRAMERLHLPPEFQTMLTPKWKEFLYNMENMRLPQNAKPCIGDYVRTLHGSGTILEIQGEFCLIDLGAHDMKLREPLTNVQVC